MSDNLKMYDVKYSATVLGTVQVEAVNFTDAKISARGRLKREGFPLEPESVHMIEAVTFAEEDEE